jgi:hypothetical protein
MGALAYTGLDAIGDLRMDFFGGAYFSVATGDVERHFGSSVDVPDHPDFSPQRRGSAREN